ncbi:MAG TPA: hypothetical protein VH575_16465 [Gemmataceae bacterium]
MAEFPHELMGVRDGLHGMQTQEGLQDLLDAAAHDREARAKSGKSVW